MQHVNVKFDSVKAFAQNMKCFNDLNIQYIEKQLGEDLEEDIKCK